MEFYSCNDKLNYQNQFVHFKSCISFVLSLASSSKMSFERVENFFCSESVKDFSLLYLTSCLLFSSSAFICFSP